MIKPLLIVVLALLPVCSLAAEGKEKFKLVEHDYSCRVFYGDSFGVMLNPPKGWVGDCKYGYSDDIPIRFYPEGTDWGNAASSIYVIQAERLGDSIEKFINGDIDNFKQNHEDPIIKDGDKIPLSKKNSKTGASQFAYVKKFQGSSPEVYEDVAYIEEPEGFVVITHTAYDQKSLDDSNDVFRQIVESYLPIPKVKK